VPKAPATLALTPIGVIRTPFLERVRAPRQSVVARDVPGTLMLDPKRHFEDALSDVDRWEYLWVLYWFHENEGWRPKVLPPRSRTRRGVFATRSPHRPNPIGMSVVRLERVEGLSVHVRGVDMLDGSPLLDLKPYVPYADALPAAGGGWLAEETAALDPAPRYEVVWAKRAAEQAAWLRVEHAVDLVPPVEATLLLGPQPHAYRRIRTVGDSLQLAVKDWRVRFQVSGRRVEVGSIHTGYRPSQLARHVDDPHLDPHRAFTERFGETSSSDRPASK
jgi:tRNA-Thr(GGU) m(6)t(6)A37 methyltransferase TsaA